MRLRRNPPPSLGRVPHGFTVDPMPWVSGTVLEDYVIDDDAGFFHVTASTGAVRSSGELLSRRELKVATLGGGGRDEAPDKVSFHVNFTRAQWMAAMLRMVSDRSLSFRSKVKSYLEECEYPDADAWAIPLDLDIEEDEEELRSALAPMAAATGIDDLEVLLDPSAIARYSEEPDTAEDCYEFLARIDGALIEMSMRNGGEDVCRPYLGLTASWRDFKRVHPDDISIVQAAIRSGVADDVNATECELRFRPQDIVLVSLDAESERLAVARDDE